MNRVFPLSLFFIVVILGFILRIYNLDKNPAGFFCDEASIGYNAYTLIKSGTDEYGVRFPIFFRSFGDYRPPIPYYSAIPFVLIFGLSEYSVRLTTAFVGTISIALVSLFAFLCLQELGYKKNIVIFGSMTAAFLLAINPWHIHMSRFGVEYVYLPFSILLAFTLTILTKKRPAFAPITAAAFALIGYTYLPAVAIGPIATLLTAFFCHKFLFSHWKYSLVSITVYVVIMLPTVIALWDGTLLTRWDHVGLGKEPLAQTVNTFTRTYIAHFSPSYLFTKGDIDYPGHFIRRFGVKGQGQLYMLDAPFILVGLLTIFMSIRKFPLGGFLLISLLLLYPIGSSITTTDGGGPLAFRSVLGSVVFPVFAAVGFTSLWSKIQDWKYKTIFLFFLVFFYISALRSYLVLYHHQYPKYSLDFWGWQFGARDVMAYFLAHQSEYDEMYLYPEFNGPDIFPRFYDPTNKCRGKCRIGDVDRFDRKKNQLFAFPAARIPANFLHVDTIPYPDGSPAFYLGKIYLSL